jgi:hypothetical protein
LNVAHATYTLQLHTSHLLRLERSLLSKSISRMIAIAIAVSLAACSGQSGLPNIATNSPTQNATKAPVKPDDGCDQTTCVTTNPGGGGGGTTGGDTTNDDVPGAGDPGGCPLAVTRGGLKAATCTGGGGGVGRLGKTAEPGQTCEGSQKAIGGWLGGTGDTSGNEINNIYEVQANNGGTSEVVGWFYTTFSSGTWFQANLTVSVSGGVAAASIGASASTPSVNVGSVSPSAIQGAMNAFDTAAGIAGSALPQPWAALVGGAQGSVSACFTSAWNGTYPS